MVYLLLFIEFFKTGLFAVGGGLATLPFLYDMAERYPWFTSEMLVDMVAIAESTPGPVGVNTATYAGFSAAGYLGSFVATFGLVLPSFIVVLLVMKLLNNFLENTLVRTVFYSIRPAVTAMILSAGLSIANVALLTGDFSNGIASAVNVTAVLLFIAVSFILYKWKTHPLIIIPACALFGIVFKM